MRKIIRTAFILIFGMAALALTLTQGISRDRRDVEHYRISARQAYSKLCGDAWQNLQAVQRDFDFVLHLFPSESATLTSRSGGDAASSRSIHPERIAFYATKGLNSVLLVLGGDAHTEAVAG